ncbi:non-ribosomal peptide synthetase [Clostridium beijerinckii]|uniref:non-ribosomal peptide synthetase n=1 Tax=Clostridium beijerinckii TaxID=1520 RepID=UPI001570D248|nr:non-ribosomal peptide synthetase [Clostridium beijerinckii]
MVHLIPHYQLKKQPEKQLYPVSSAQKRVFILNELINDNTSYNMPMAIIIKGKLEVEVIEKAFKELVKRHEALRTSFEFKDKELMQHIHKDIEFNMKYLEIQEDNIDEMIKNFVKPFDLGKGPLLRACLARLSENKYLLLYDMHHIISDGTSINILMQELFDLYKGKRLDNLRIQYKDFSVWQNEFFKSEDIKKQEDYWLQAFSGEIPTLNMPTDYKRMPLQSFEGDKITFELETYLADKVDELVKETKTTMYMVFLAIYNTLLYKYTGQECIIIGSPISGRKHSDLEKVIGMFVNTLPMMNYPTGDKTFMEFLEEVRENTSKAYENQDYQFDELVEKLHLNRDLSRNPLFDTMFSFANQNEKEKNSVYNIEFSEYEFSNSVAKFDLDLNCTKGKTGIKFDFEYCTKLYRRETIESMTNYFVNIIKKVVDNPYIKLRDIDMLSIEEKDKILFKFNNTKSVYDKELTVYQLFENQAKKTPDNIALVFENQQISYKDLNAKANQVARILVKNGVKREDIVGIMAKRSIEMIIAIMGILKTGAAYLPIDPEYPNDRITYILEDSGSKMLLTQKELFNKISFDGEKISLDDSDIWEEDNSNLNIINNSSSLAYVIYTSGSTGKPKGVMIEHRAVNNFIQGITERIEFIEGKTILALTTICFDIFLLETILPLVKGLKVIIANENEQIESNALAKVISKGIDMLQITPSRLKMLISNEKNAQCLDSLTDIMIGGEPLPHGILEELQKKIKARIYNMYGPTETTVWSTLSDLSKSATIHIGKPISNTQVYILDKNNSVLPINVVGELCISGDGLARGYLNRNELNLEKFVDNPFATTENMICKRMYKTGDLAKWLPDGNIQIIGRIDHQLKIRGYRIEPGEIEKVILKYEDIKEAVVIDYEDKNETKYLCAYIVSIKNEHTISKLREYLTKELPEYMIPSYFIQLDKIPLTYNGKIDRKLLPVPDGIINLSNEYIAPRNDLEEKLTKLWSDVLDVNKLGIDDNFFELGGHSLKAAMLISRIDNDLNVQIPLGELFKNPTIRHLANYIQNKNVHEYKAISKANKREYYPIPSPLKTILKYEHETGSKGIYNKTEILIVQGDLDKDRLEKAIRALIKRHEILRTAFEIIDGEPIQKVYEYDDVVFKIDNIKETQGKLDDIVADYVKPFDLSKPPLIRVGLMELEQQKYALLFDMHQAITDGTSTNILIKEIKDLYEGKDLSPETIQYKDYSIWYSEFHKSDEVQKKREFWLDLFSGKIPLLDFPTDYERHGIEDYRAERIVFKLNKELTHSLNKLAYEYNATLYMVLLSAYYIMLNHNTKQEDIVVGTPIAARPHIDLQNMMGLFANNITMRNYPRKDMTFLEFLKEVKTNALKAFENQEYEFEQIIDELQLDTPPNRNPLFDTMFALHNIHNEEFEIDNLKLIPHDIKFWAIKYDFVLHANEVDEEIHFDFRYRTALFKDDTMKKVVEEYILIIQNIIDNPEFKLGEIKI